MSITFSPRPLNPLFLGRGILQQYLYPEVLRGNWGNPGNPTGMGEKVLG